MNPHPDPEQEPEQEPPGGGAPPGGRQHEDRRDGRSTGADERTGGARLERVLGAVGAVLLAALLGFLGYQASTRDGDSRVLVDLVAVERTPAGFVTTVEVTNGGGETARSVQVHGEIVRNGTTVSQASATVPYVPADSRRRAVLVFGADPAGADLRLRAVGYVAP
ncbi:hypothetical protein [Kineococcus sp. G2]|uniref:hypothetical protein n=1 Tax=Kineococcus sp. G2 TaxID=3127484 RepID=UPI00301CCE63